MAPDFSIIVPVYNSEQYLEKCIKAVLSQGDFNYELLLVNDGSPDNSLEICNAFAAKDSRIRVFSQENGGLCSARNKGIENARGKYLLFIDNDDEIADNTLAVLHSWIEKKDYDIIRFNRKRIQTFDNGKTKTDIYGTKGICDDGPVEVTSKELFTNYRKFKKSGCFSGIWNALFRRELFEDAGIRFDTSITAGYEDFLVNIQAFRAAKNMLFLPDVLYVYFRRTSHSVSTTYKENQIYALKLVANAEKDMLAHIPYADVHEIYTSDVNYLGQIIKVLAHRNCPLTLMEKTQVIDDLNREDAFRFGRDWKKYVKGTEEKAYLSLFVNKRYVELYFLSAAVLKMRGNT